LKKQYERWWSIDVDAFESKKHFLALRQGVIVAQVGKIVFTFDADGNFTGVAFEAGKHPDLLPALCAALA